MTSSSQKIWSPANPGRFMYQYGDELSWQYADDKSQLNIVDPSSPNADFVRLFGALKALGNLFGVLKSLGHRNVTIDDRIQNLMADRGWTEKSIRETIRGKPAGRTMDQRSGSKTPDGLKRNDTASVYGSKNGYVVVNDRTGEVAAISDKTDLEWTADSRITWFGDQ